MKILLKYLFIIVFQALPFLGIAQNDNQAIDFEYAMLYIERPSHLTFNIYYDNGKIEDYGKAKNFKAMGVKPNLVNVMDCIKYLEKQGYILITSTYTDPNIIFTFKRKRQN
jgi:hypothetical protein